ncbi:MAG: DUF4145 domain-containing protein [Pseudomonadota bacterium]
MGDFEKLSDNSLGDGGAKALGYHLPRTVSTKCEHCKNIVAFGLGRSPSDVKDDFLQFSAKCPHCQESSAFVFRFDKKQQELPIELFVFRTTNSQTIRSSRLLQSFPKLADSLERAEQAFSSGDYIACCGHLRRTIEGLLREKLPPGSNKKEMLGKLLTRAETELNFSGPISDLAKTIQDGGNMALHFDQELEPDAEIAAELFEMSVSLIQYVEEIPVRIQEIRKRIG